MQLSQKQKWSPEVFYRVQMVFMGGQRLLIFPSSPSKPSIKLLVMYTSEANLGKRLTFDFILKRTVILTCITNYLPRLVVKNPVNLR